MSCGVTEPNLSIEHPHSAQGTAQHPVTLRCTDITIAQIEDALNAGDARAYKIVVPDGANGWEISGTCIVKGYERMVPIDDRMTATLTDRFTGSSTEAAGAA